ncbi:DUF4386 domain-containing protein [Haloferax prahovense]|uniref:DUF4386 domain-containing protein n=1 Tax=Haloferax prahovense TaxID=381852 RepID=UPI00126787FE|nr:DUF4386 domain-containing protein [Haloferax prahovense]
MNFISKTSDVVPGGDRTDRLVRSASVIGGIGLLLMLVPALFGTLVVVKGLVTPGDATATALAIQDAAGAFRLGIVGLFAVAILDVIVAWALYTVFEPVNRRVSQLALLFRVVYAGVFVVAISQLVGVIGTLTDPGALAAYTTAQLHAQAMLGINAFHDIWNAGLLLFAVHLLLLGYLAYQADYVPTLVGILLVIAGFGYAIDSIGTVLVADYSLQVTIVTFVGEIVLIGWLLLRGRRVSVGAEEATLST